MNSKATARYGGKNRIDFKEQPDGRFRYVASFAFKTLACRIDGTWDPKLDVPGPVKFLLKANAKKTFEMVTAEHDRGIATHIKFGSAVKGTKQLYLFAERFDDINLISGTADGRPLLPMRIEGCACNAADLEESVLATFDGKKISYVSVTPDPPLPPKEIEGLTVAMRRGMNTFASSSGPILDDIVRGGRYVLCLVGCYVQFFGCLVTIETGLTRKCFMDLTLCKVDCRLERILPL